MIQMIFISVFVVSLVIFLITAMLEARHLTKEDRRCRCTRGDTEFSNLLLYSGGLSFLFLILILFHGFITRPKVEEPPKSRAELYKDCIERNVPYNTPSESELKRGEMACKYLEIDKTKE